MNKSQLILLFILSLSVSNVFGQGLTEKQKEKEKVKVELFSSEEKDNLQYWFQDEIKKFGFTEEQQSNYQNTLLMYSGKMMRLDDMDQGLSKDEILQKLNELSQRFNLDVKDQLSDSQFQMHKELMYVLKKSISNKLSEKLKD